jgi:hypothetical protein
MVIKPLPPGVSPGMFSASRLDRSEMGRIETDFWAAVILRPELSGGVPQFAVIIKTHDDEDMRDAFRIGFVPLTPDHLMKYLPATGSFYVDHASSERGRKMRRFNRSILNKYR